MLRNAIRFFKAGQRAFHSLSPTSLNPSASNKIARRLGLVQPISDPLKIAKDPKPGEKNVISEYNHNPIFGRAATKEEIKANAEQLKEAGNKYGY